MRKYKNMSKRIYIAGPYTNEDPMKVKDNVKKAIDVAEDIHNYGFIPYIPHLFHYWHKEYNHSYNFWMKQGSSWLDVCDGLYRMCGDSPGSDVEVSQAKKNGIPVFYDFYELNAYFENE